MRTRIERKGKKMNEKVKEHTSNIQVKEANNSRKQKKINQNKTQYEEKRGQGKE